jgi:succinoglycan biosynthesis protein ExoV
MAVLYRWKSRTRGENYGDALSVPLLQALGCGVTVIGPGERAQEALFCIGSILHYPHYGCADRIRVWGSGVGEAGKPSHVTYCAVRGPVTARLLELACPLGDPALLAPRLLRVPSVPSEVLKVRHIHSTVRDGEVGTADADLTSRIAAAHFVASESLHGCIVAAAYGVPWAPWAPDGEPPGHTPLKWQDWMEYLGLGPFVFCRTMREALRWWNWYGRYGKLRDLGPLLDAFPGA